MSLDYTILVVRVKRLISEDYFWNFILASDWFVRYDGFMIMTGIWVITLFLLIWVVVLTINFFKLKNHYDTLISGVSKKTLEGVLTGMVKDIHNTKRHIVHLSERCDTIEKDALLHIQKIGLLRFNPFKDTGGDQSFILSLLDAKDTGVVITALYSRSGTRWYAKKIVEGKGSEHELSEDEKKALKLASGINQG